ncbi:MAG: phosphoglycerate kinase [Flavobacteriales bacterium]|nr:phosphoglycerate kinase [Flavobacteriales bacterium]
MDINTYDFKGKKVLIRVDFNVPLDESLNVTDNTRIKRALPTIKKVIENEGVAIIMSHLGRPKNGPENKFSLSHVKKELSELLNCDVHFLNDCVGKEVESAIANAENGSVYLLENLRFHEEEKKGDNAFAKSIASLGDAYINDAFGTAHRAHASTAIVADFFEPSSKLFGYLMANEILNIDKVLASQETPVTAIIGGAKVSSKITILENLVDKVDHILIGGGMAFTLLKVAGAEIGNSLFEEDYLELAESILKKTENSRANVVLPKDVIIADQFDNNANTQIANSHEIPKGWMGLDIGPESILFYENIIGKSKVILWNGPMGVFEMPSFENGTKSIALSVAKSTKNGAFSVIGGGDSVAAINKFNLSSQVSFVSTGGGAMLEYLEGKKLPGIAAISGE